MNPDHISGEPTIAQVASQVAAADRGLANGVRPDTVDNTASQIISANRLVDEFDGVPGAPEGGLFSGHNGWRLVVGALGVAAIAAAATVSSPVIALAAVCAGGRLLYSAIANDFQGGEIATPIAKALSFGVAGALIPFSPGVAIAVAAVAETSISPSRDGGVDFTLGGNVIDKLISKPIPLILFAIIALGVFGVRRRLAPALSAVGLRGRRFIRRAI